MFIVLLEDIVFTTRRKNSFPTICTPSEKAKKKERFLIVFVVVACGYSPIALTYL
jgi:hypothetical protein